MVRADLQDLIQRKGAVVRVEGPLPAVAGDRERVMQLLANLFANGLKYNKSETPEVVLGAKPESDEQPPGESNADFATLFVRDNGIGIEAQYHDQIFRMFRRLHRREEVEGTGAGLAICKKIVERTAAKSGSNPRRAEGRRSISACRVQRRQRRRWKSRSRRRVGRRRRPCRLPDGLGKTVHVQTVVVARG